MAEPDELTIKQRQTLQWLLELWDELDTAAMPQLAFLVLWRELRKQECRFVGDVLLMDFSRSSPIPEPERCQIVRYLQAMRFCSMPLYPLDETLQRLFLEERVKRDGTARAGKASVDPALREQEGIIAVRSRPIEEIEPELSTRVFNAVARAGCRTLGDLADMTRQDLLSRRSFGVKSLREVEEALNKRGLRLKEENHSNS